MTRLTILKSSFVASALLVAGCTAGDTSGMYSGGPAVVTPGYTASGYAPYSYSGYGGSGWGSTDYERRAARGDSYCQEATAAVRRAESQAAVTGNYGRAARAQSYASRDC